uniref:hypothetical protein n=1 Tax=Acetatifactor sp. TaxID=1872090 RepID=UPI0040571CA8
MKDIDALLSKALNPEREPSPQLNLQIMQEAKEREYMKLFKKKKMPAVVLVAAMILCFGSITVVAAWKHLSPDMVAEKIQETKLADAFQGEDAILVNETQSMAGYNVTLLGIVSGEELAAVPMMNNGKLVTDKTYVVTAIENADGTPMPDTSDEEYGIDTFLVTPLITGLNPRDYNAVTMNGGYHEIWENGILYRITECDNVEIFADRKLYIAVLDDTFYQADAYRYDEGTGEIARNEDYNGLNVLFTLPIPSNLADPEAAVAYVEQMEASVNSTFGGEEEESQGSDVYATDVEEFIAQITPQNIAEYAEKIDSIVCVPDEEGRISYAYEIAGRGGANVEGVMVSALFPDGPGTLNGVSYHSSGTMDSLLMEVCTLREDGNVVIDLYVPMD